MPLFLQLCLCFHSCAILLYDSYVHFCSCAFFLQLCNFFAVVQFADIRSKYVLSFSHRKSLHSLLTTPLPSSSHHRFCLCRRAAGSAFVVTPPLPFLLLKRCLPCGAIAPFIVAPPLPSSSPMLIVAWFCHRRCAAAAFLVAPPLPSLSHRHFCLRRRAVGSAFVVVPSVPLLHLAVGDNRHPDN